MTLSVRDVNAAVNTTGQKSFPDSQNNKVQIHTKTPGSRLNNVYLVPKLYLYNNQKTWFTSYVIL